MLTFTGNKGEAMWTHARSLKRLVRIIKKLQKQGREFRIYNCYNEKEMDKKKQDCVMGLINKQEKEVLQLDD